MQCKEIKNIWLLFFIISQLRFLIHVSGTTPFEISNLCILIFILFLCFISFTQKFDLTYDLKTIIVQ